MRLAPDAHASRPWRIHEIAPELRLEDVWALPTPGAEGDFPRLVRMMSAFDPSRRGPPPVRALFGIRRALGGLLGWDAPRPDAPTLRGRLPDDLRDSAPAPASSAALPFTPLYLTAGEFAAEISNRTVHGVLHLGWVPDGAPGAYRGQMAVLVQREGLLGSAYMAAITPFRHRLVYPAMLRAIGEAWRGDRMPVAAPPPRAGA